MKAFRPNNFQLAQTEQLMSFLGNHLFKYYQLCMQLNYCLRKMNLR